MSDEQIPASSYQTPEFIRLLLRKQPYRVFCDKLLKDFTSREFEKLVAELFREIGGNVTLCKRGVDGGIDILIEDGEETYIVQCKRWKNPVGVKAIREIWAVADKKRAKGAIIVTISEFTNPAEQFLIDLRPPMVRLVNGKELFDLMNQHMPVVVADILEGRRKGKNNEIKDGGGAA